MSSYEITTTSIDVTLSDLGLKPITHPTIGLDLIGEHGCSISELVSSIDLANAISGGFITVNKVNVQSADDLNQLISNLSGYAQRFEKSGTFKNRYLKYGNIPLNNTPYIVAKDSTIVSVHTIEQKNVAFDIEISVNGSLVSTLSWAANDPAEKSGLNIQLLNSDELTVYMSDVNAAKVKNLASQFFFKTHQ